jgi:hypothetical protein
MLKHLNFGGLISSMQQRGTLMPWWSQPDLLQKVMKTLWKEGRLGPFPLMLCRLPHPLMLFTVGIEAVESQVQG